MKYFVSSDIHGFYTEYKKALDKAGFDINNPEHILIVCGDIWDRGTQPLEVYNFLKSIPKERRILIRGNHEYLLRDLVNRGYAYDHDISNGTYDSLCYVAKEPTYNEYLYKIIEERTDASIPALGTPEYEDYAKKQQEESKKRSNKLFKNKKIKAVLQWIFSDEWVNYYELDNYIFVHGFIPLREYIDIEKSRWCGYFVKYQPDEYREDWRNAKNDEWEDASWFNWKEHWNSIKKGINKTNKYIVVGHWHTSDLWNHLSKAKEKTINNNPIFKSNKYKIIALDTCTVITKKVNVLVINNE